MYQVDEKDVVIPIEDFPRPSVGAPCPLVIADEHRLLLAYYVQTREPGWDGTTVREVNRVTSSEPIALVCFNLGTAHMFGPPNDEAFAGHPLAKRGLRPYRVHRVESSSWIRRLERMNSVHSQHSPEPYWGLRHLIFAFHDSTFECVCREFDVRTRHGSIMDMVPEMVELLHSRSQ
jgi:hypothetical protein